MRAAVMRNAELVVDDLPDPVPGPYQVLVSTLACGICGSDLHALKHGDRMVEMSRLSASPFVMDLQRDVVMGHEFCAEVLELGKDTGGNLAPGDRVVSIPVMITPTGGMQALGYSNEYPGGYAERMLLSSMVALKVPNGLDSRRAALTEPMAVGRHAVERSGIAPGAAAVVLGCGPVGLAVIADLARRGIAPIIAADFSPVRRALATSMGAHEVVDPATEPAIDAFRRIDGTKRLTIFEAVGVPGMLDAAMLDAPTGSRVLVVGVCMEPDTIRPMIGVAKELDIGFALGYSPVEFADTLHAIAEGELDVAPLITGTVDIDGVAGAFAELGSPDAHCKILVEP